MMFWCSLLMAGLSLGAVPRWSSITTLLLLTVGLSQSLGMRLENMASFQAYLEFVESVAVGARLGIDECRHQFKWRTWNCPVPSAPVFTSTAEEANRENSFVQAITSAGVTHTVARNCSLGQLTACDCDSSRNGQKGGARWIWGGCSDNVNFGEMIATQFVVAMETGHDAQAQVRLHNHAAGRWGVRRTMNMLCKCHGVSGSCTTKTCWQQLPSLRSVGLHLKRRYLRAVRVDFQNGALHEQNQGTSGHASASVESNMATSARRRRARGMGDHKIKNTDLVYLNPSPNYCSGNDSIVGRFGTLGRRCVRSESADGADRDERKSCSRICRACGLRVRSRVETVETRCDCKFHWCCTVQCQTCVNKQTVYTCTL